MHCVFYDTLPIIHPISRTFCFYSISFSISFSIYGTQSCVLLRSYSTFGWILPGCTPVLCPRSPLFFPFFFPYNIDVREILLMHCVFYDTLRLYDSILLQSRAHTAPILRTYCFNPAHILLQSCAHTASIPRTSCFNPAPILHQSRAHTAPYLAYIRGLIIPSVSSYRPSTQFPRLRFYTLISPHSFLHLSLYSRSFSIFILLPYNIT